MLAVGDPAVDVYLKEEYAILNKFEKEKKIKVDFNIVSFAEYYTELISSFREYKYDIVMVAGHLWLKEFVEKGYLLELENEFVDDYDYNDILETIREEIEINGRKYLLPSFCDGHILIYRESEFGNNLAEVNNILQVKNIIENYDSDEAFFSMKADPSEIFLDTLPYFRARGVEPFSDSGEALFNTQEGVQALTDYLELKKYCSKEVNNYGNHEVKNAIQNKEAKLALSWSGQLGQITDKNCLEVEDLAFKGLNNSWNTTWSFAVNHLSQNRDLAELFMQYISNKEVDKIVGEYCGSPTRLSNFIEGKDSYRWYSVVLEMLKKARPLPDLVEMSELIAICSEQFTKAFNDQITAEIAVRTAAKKINNL